MKEYTERYKNLSNSDLLRVLENPSDYQPKAVEAAEHELKRRNLSSQEIEEVQKDFELARQEKDRQKEEIDKVNEKLKAFGSSFFNLINPIQAEVPSAERQIKSLSLLFGLIAIVQWYQEFGLVSFMLSEDPIGWDLSMFEYFLPLLLLPLAVILFWLRKKSGWILLAIYLTYSAISAAGLIMLTWDMKGSAIPALDNLLPQSSPISHILSSLFFGAALWVLNQKKIRDHYHIHKQVSIITLTISAAFTLLFISQFFL
ncbi:MAG: hypothetical protein AAGD28_24435 [Bacteroidota bacterium]